MWIFFDIYPNPSLICVSFNLLIIFSQWPSAQHYPPASSELSEALRRVVDLSLNWLKCHSGMGGSFEGLLQKKDQTNVVVAGEKVFLRLSKYLVLLFHPHVQFPLRWWFDALSAILSKAVCFFPSLLCSLDLIFYTSPLRAFLLFSPEQLSLLRCWSTVIIYTYWRGSVWNGSHVLLPALRATSLSLPYSIRTFSCLAHVVQSLYSWICTAQQSTRPQWFELEFRLWGGDV